MLEKIDLSESSLIKNWIQTKIIVYGEYLLNNKKQNFFIYLLILLLNRNDVTLGASIQATASKFFNFFTQQTVGFSYSHIQCESK